MDQDSDVVSISSSSNSDGESESLVDTNPSAASTTSTCPSSSASRNPPRAREGEESADDETIYRYGRERRRAYKDVGGRLGSGSEARVKLVVSREDGRQYALKVVPKPSDPAIKKRIERNARRRWDRLASLLTDHPNVGVFQEGFETSSQWYATMEIFQGDLDSYLARHESRLTEAQAARVVAIVLAVAAHMHQGGVFHRDIKPGNLFLRDKEDPTSCCLGDFTSCFVVPLPSESASTDDPVAGPILSATVTGTPYYLAPEIVIGSPYGPKVDVWSIGVLAYHVLFGTTPFQDSATWGILFNRISSAEYTIPDDPTVSDAAKAFVRRLLQADPSKRPSALEALEDPWLVEHRFAAMKLRPDEEKVVPGDEIVPGSQSEGGHSLVSLAERDHAPGDDGFRTVFMESGVRVYFDEEAGALRISDPKSSQAPNTTESFNHAEAERTLQPRLKAGYVDFTEEKKDIEI